MKVKLNLLYKLKICHTFLKSGIFTTGLVEVCPKCGSVDVANINPHEKLYKYGSDYNTVYKCNKCGSKALVTEEWYFDTK